MIYRFTAAGSEYLKIMIFDFGDFMFDTDKSDLFEYMTAKTLTISATNSSKYIDGVLYLFYTLADGYVIGKYDKTIYTDLGETVTAKVSKTVVLNNVSPTDKIIKLQNIHTDYSSSIPLVLIPIVDDTEKSGTTLSASSKYSEFKLPTSVNYRGRTAAVKYTISEGNPQINTILIKIDTDIHQRRLIKNNG